MAFTMINVSASHIISELNNREILTTAQRIVIKDATKYTPRIAKSQAYAAARTKGPANRYWNATFSGATTS